MMANHLNHHLKRPDWRISIIDERTEHHYQPGYLFLPFDIYEPEDIIKSIEEFIPKTVDLIQGAIDKVVPKENKVLMRDGSILVYDVLIVATGAKTAPEEIEGMKGSEWYKSVFDFYTFEGSLSLRNKLRDWQGGKLVPGVSNSFLLIHIRWLNRANVRCDLTD